MISTRDLSQLPDINGLCRLLKSIALLDAILCRDWQFPFYAFKSSAVSDSIPSQQAAPATEL